MLKLKHDVTRAVLPEEVYIPSCMDFRNQAGQEVVLLSGLHRLNAADAPAETPPFQSFLQVLVLSRSWMHEDLKISLRESLLGWSRTIQHLDGPQQILVDSVCLALAGLLPRLGRSNME